MELSQDDISEIQRLLESSPYAELTIETPRQRMILRRAADGAWTQETETLSEPQFVSPIGNESVAASAGVPREGTTVDGLVNVYPPLPGTFYRAPKPGAEPFVQVGSSVDADSVVGIIETMKLMNPARAGVAGTIAEICAANGELLEDGQVLMRVRPAAEARA